MQNFSNEELKHVDPVRLMKKEKADNIADFFLVLGVFYNDLKSFMYYSALLDETFKKVNKEKISAETGEYFGMKIHLEKLTISTIHEFFAFIKKSKNILETQEFKSVYVRLPRYLKKQWDILVKISINNKAQETSKFSKLFLLIRNNLGFHYDQAPKILREGFIEHFFLKQRDQVNEKAYYSIGEAMIDTRFFYADAAVQRSLDLQMEKIMTRKDFNLEFRQTIDAANFTISRLLKEYLRNRPK